MITEYRRRTARPDHGTVAMRKEALADAVLIKMMREVAGTPAQLLRAQANEAAARHALLVATLAVGWGPTFESVAPQLRAALDKLESD